ncbi:MAG: pyridoxal phosphate-dependent aminotransferase [Acidobacteriota bacterium]|nr:MAG: pyridoxal phosphate-dependent aminotransferase [Acidobacteriota bacterium]
MPQKPGLSSVLAEIGGSLFSSLAHRLAARQGEVYPLHVGDTWLEPPMGSRVEDLSADRHPGLHRYGPPWGLPELRDALAARAEARTGVPTTRENVLVAAGATGGLHAVAGAILEPGDEVLLLAPHWPLIAGIVRCFRGRPVALPLLDRHHKTEQALETLRRHRTARTVALYVNSPNNPTGRVLSPAWLAEVIGWARDEGLWILADEVYEDCVFDGEHVYARSLAPESTFSVHSFSKGFAMAGNRCGYVVGPREPLREVCKVSTHAVYSAPTCAQRAALAVLTPQGDAWQGEVRDVYREQAAVTAARLGVAPPQGSTFLFLDVASALDDRGLLGFLEDGADRGLLLAPGPSFGPFPTHVRVCFTAAPREVVCRGVEILAAMLARAGTAGR